MIKEDRLLKNAMDTTSELSNLIKKSPKREGMLQKIRDDLSLECPGFRVLCPGRWTVRAITLKSILDNWTAINSMWTISLEENSDPEMRGRINGVQAKMVKFEYFFSINILQILLRDSDNLSKTLQSPKITASEGQKLSNLTVKTLISLRSYALFSNLWQKLKKEANTLGIKGYLRFKTITPQNVLPEAQVKNFLFCRKVMLRSQDIQVSSSCVFSHPAI